MLLEISTFLQELLHNTSNFKRTQKPMKHCNIQNGPTCSSSHVILVHFPHKDSKRVQESKNKIFSYLTTLILIITQSMSFIHTQYPFLGTIMLYEISLNKKMCH